MLRVEGPSADSMLVAFLHVVAVRLRVRAITQRAERRPRGSSWLRERFPRVTWSDISLVTSLDYSNPALALSAGFAVRAGPAVQSASKEKCLARREARGEIGRTTNASLIVTKDAAKYSKTSKCSINGSDFTADRTTNHPTSSRGWRRVLDSTVQKIGIGPRRAPESRRARLFAIG